MSEPDFWDFVFEGGYDLLFPEDEDNTYQCSSCKQIIKGDEKVKWIDKEKTIFECPKCGEVIKNE